MDRPYVPHTSSSGAGEMSGRVTPQIIDIMLRTKGSVRFIAVMLFINFGITIINLIVTMNAPSRFGGDAERIGQFIGIGVALLLYLYPAVKLNSYASRIGALLQSARTGDLEAALNEHRGFWRFVGIVTIVLVSIFVLFIFIGMVAAVSRSSF
ncbi:hypothetical protein LBMAG57_13480 [Verrucomicrobiota bacterium]|jgi:hypothetical protein|nr:hypothetical protein LBMAG57_13480 [Verrucomicrobiota bacterium]